ncbi:hypothetical protein BEN74_03855 [Acinetobacter sp. WCHAc010034]|uniref:hypothetical protein n=1 Tax=Acinetobacter sp. WCHAc010034 TaxID=1879049 RepID=UPI00083AF804|nr:hypothetical protein [Acinetobacter sp. WCHAc010034]AYA02086.1 hypothetical protein BEN74_03855 [Acinetobacter sp. WCHAc010034]
MHKLSEIKPNFIQELYDAFNGVNLKNGFTLLEEDFADTSYLRRYPHQYPYDIDGENCFSKQNLLDEIKNSSLLPEEKNDLTLAIEEGKRVNNQYITWDTVPFEYLDKYANGFYFITPNVYVFYTAALIKNLILNIEYFKGVAFDKWLSRLLMENLDHTMLIKLNNHQSSIIKKFLYTLLSDNYILEYIDVANIKKAIQLL